MSDDHSDACRFVREAIEFSIQRHGRPHRKLTVQALCEGVRAYALERFGPLAYLVLSEWGIRSNKDVGDIVFELIHERVLAADAADRIEDFSDGPEFSELLRRPFLPEGDPVDPQIIA